MGRGLHARALTSLTEPVQRSAVCIMFLLKFSQFLCFCGVKGGYDFLLEVFQVVAEIDHTTVIQVVYHCAVLWFCMIALWQMMASQIPHCFSAAWH